MASLEVAIEHALRAKRIVGNAQSYRKDNPVESTGVFEYLNGGGRPIGVLTEMGLFLVEVEDVRRGGSSNVARSEATGPVA